MDSIQTICMCLSMTPMNGRVDNELNPSIAELMSNKSKDVTIWDLADNVERIEIHTHHDEDDMAGYERSLIKEACFYYPGVVDPLVLDLMPGHMAFPRLPTQLFKKTAKGDLIVIENPYIRGDLNDVYKTTTKLYIMLSFLCGYGGKNIRPQVIRKITLKPKDHTVDIDRSPDLSEETFLKLQENLSEKITNDSQGNLDHFLINFMPAMKYKSVHGLKEVPHDGKVAFQNVFTKGDWTSEDRAKPLKDSLGELSFERMSESCPAYISHWDRLERYSLSILPVLLDLNLDTLTKEAGIPDLDSDTFFKTGSGMALVDLHKDLLFNLFNHCAMNLGDLLDAYNMLVSIETH